HTPTPPDLDPLLTQTARIHPAALTDKLQAALTQRQHLKHTNRYAYQRHLAISSFSTAHPGVDDTRLPDLPDPTS
ncbi:hypothetical protein, partial [Mycobacterium nebraskense]|uniref:hypothetical protein n=1 Tax=Mycobacterium nebraskense TaxID=244292 RepID=UPI00142E87B7